MVFEGKKRKCESNGKCAGANRVTMPGRERNVNGWELGVDDEDVLNLSDGEISVKMERKKRSEWISGRDFR
jgi:hypothetical protein